ncbi:unnamed protein product [Ectocarpus sp. CCAP 1310/34]|nr:unnamed protein product [Ectocarpus sp. CCAP 1310/34]
MSELSELRTLVETTHEIVSDQTKGLDQGTHSLAKAASGSSSKVLNVLETTTPSAFLSLETRLSRVEETVAAAAETAAATVATAKDAAAAATAAASAASALARRFDESVVGIDCRERRPVADSVSDGLSRKGDRSPITDGGRLSPAPQQQYHQQHEGQHHQCQHQHQQRRQQQHQQRWQQAEEKQQQQQEQRQQRQEQRQQRQEQRQTIPPPEILLGGIISGSAQGSGTRGGRKRKNDDQQLEHQEPPSRRVFQQSCTNRGTKPQLLMPVIDLTFSASRKLTNQWQGADESLRWTQPWGGEAGPATAAAAGASSRVRRSPRHDPETPRGVLEQRNSCHGGSGGEREERFPPSTGGASSSFASSAVPYNNRNSQRVVDDAEVDMPSSSLPLCEADSFNPFQDADLVPITTGSIGAKAPGNVSTSRRQGSRSPPAPNTFPAEQSATMRSGLAVRPAARDSSGKSPIADATAAAPTVSSSSSTSTRPTSTAGTRGGAVAGEPSFSGSHTRMITRKAKAGLRQGDGGAGRTQASGAGDAPVGHMVQSQQPPPPRSSPSGSSAPPAAASGNPFSRGPSMDRGDPASSVGGVHTAAESKANCELSHDVSVRTNRRNVSGLDQAQAGLIRSDGRTPHEESGKRKPTSADVGVIEDEIEDYEDSLGGPGLTVEAYMAEKHKAKRYLKGQEGGDE